MKRIEVKKAVVLVSGGLDSATVLAMANEEDYQCYALSIDYGQRHKVELQRAGKIAKAAFLHRVVRINMDIFGGSALTDTTIDVPTASETKDIPVTYVPARNTVFLSIALGWAEILSAEAIFIGANAVDYSGYPDCREAYLQAYQTMANLATKQGVEGKIIEIKAPILSLSKAEIIQKGISLGVDYDTTLSCYNPSDTGHVCKVCDACIIRAEGFTKAGVVDTINE